MLDCPAGTSCHVLRRVLATDSQSTGFSTLIPTATKPSGAGVIDLYDPDLGIATQNVPLVDDMVFLQPYGSDAANEDYHLRVTGWSRISDASLGEIWVPVMLAQLVVTLGNINASVLGTDMYLADTITETYGESDGAVLIETISPANDLPASVMVHIRGSELLQFEFDLDAGGAASARGNCLWRPVST